MIKQFNFAKAEIFIKSHLEVDVERDLGTPLDRLANGIIKDLIELSIPTKRIQSAVTSPTPLGIGISESTEV